MVVQNEGLARRAFAGILDLKRSASVGELDITAADLFGGLGLPSFALAQFFKGDRSPDTRVIAGHFQPDWSQRYIAKGYARTSTISREMLTDSAPYSWTGVIKKRGLDSDQARIWNEASEFGLTDGLFTPVRWGNGSYAAVVLAGKQPLLTDPMLLIAAETLSAYYASELRRLISPSGQTVRLSGRQRECLAWVRQGKSSSAIGEILNISPLTVDEHIAEACTRLGVRTRVQAAIEAVLLGVIE
jgi:DNA-binding CsgD family transcriptional regulator